MRLQMFRTTIHQFGKRFDADAQQVSDRVIQMLSGIDPELAVVDFMHMVVAVHDRGQHHQTSRWLDTHSIKAPFAKQMIREAGTPLGRSSEALLHTFSLASELADMRKAAGGSARIGCFDLLYAGLSSDAPTVEHLRYHLRATKVELLQRVGAPPVLLELIAC